MNVLLVDDEFLVRIGLRSAIDWEAHGYTLAGDARSAEEALSLIPILEPVVVITDIIMGEMSGLELMQRVKERDMAASFVILTSHRDFSFAQKAIEFGAVDYILKHEITSASIISALRKATIHIEHGDKDVKRVKKAEIHYPFKRILHLSIDHYTSVLQRRKEKDPTRMHASLIGLIDQLCSSYCHIKLLRVEKHICIFLLSFPSVASDEQVGWNTHVRRIAHRVTSIMNITVHLALSSLQEEPQVEELLQRLTLKIDEQFSRKTQFFVEGVTEEFQKPSSLNYLQEHPAQEGKKLWLAKSFQEIPPLFVSLCTGLSKTVVIEEALNLLRFIQGRTEGNTEWTISYEEQIKTATDLESIEQVFSELVENNLQHNSHKEQEYVSEPIQRAITYIHAHYHKAIGLEELASIANKSPNYFSTLFSATMHVSPISYINTVRVEHACDALIHTNMTMKEIADFVGFPNEKYFFRMFKKYKGVSPGAYRSENSTP